MAFFTYTLLSGIPEYAKANVKQMACANEGIYAHIDGGNLADEMATYYNYFARGTADASNRKVRWVLYPDAAGAELFGACSSAFDFTVDPPKLIGVTCMDVNMLADIDTLKAQPSWDSFVENVVEKTTSCDHVKFSTDQLQTLRGRIGGSSSVCSPLIWPSDDRENVFACTGIGRNCPAASIAIAFPASSVVPSQCAPIPSAPSPSAPSPWDDEDETLDGSASAVAVGGFAMFVGGSLVGLLA